MTTADLHTPTRPVPADRAAVPACDTVPTRGAVPTRRTDLAGRRPLRGAAEALRRVGRWAADDLRAGAEMSARRDVVRTADERRYLGRP